MPQSPAAVLSEVGHGIFYGDGFLWALLGLVIVLFLIAGCTGWELWRERSRVQQGRAMRAMEGITIHQPYVA